MEFRTNLRKLLAELDVKADAKSMDRCAFTDTCSQIRIAASSHDLSYPPLTHTHGPTPLSHPPSHVPHSLFEGLDMDGSGSLDVRPPLSTRG